MKGQQEAAANVLRLLEGSAIIESHRWCDKVQDAYSLRCAPQVHGACRDLLDYVEATIAVELNAATDNPLVLVEEGAHRLGGKLPRPAAGLRARRRSRWRWPSSRASRSGASSGWSIPTLSDGLPPFLVEEGGLNSGFMIPQYVAAALVSENKVFAHPASVDSIPTSAGQEDHVSMGNAAGLKALRVLDNAERTLAIELLAGTQAVEFLAPLQPGDGARGVHDFVRSLSSRLVEDRSLSWDIEQVATAIRSGEVTAAVEEQDRSDRMTDLATVDAAVEALARRPDPNPGASRIDAERALLADRGAAADAAEQPRPRGRGASREARRLRRYRQGGAQPRGAQGDRADAPPARRRRDAARPEREAGRRLQDRASGRRASSSPTRCSSRAGRRGTSSAGWRPRV